MTQEPVTTFMERSDVKHTLRLVPSSQRELFEFELRGHITTLYNDAVREERERVLKGFIDKYYVYAEEDGQYQHDPEYNQILDALRYYLTTPTQPNKDTNH